MTRETTALIGATGGMGSFVLSELDRRAVPTRIVVRRADAVPARDLLRPVLADVYDRASLAAALTGIETVISAFNPGWSAPDLYQQFLRGSRNIQSACRDAGVGRLIVIGGASSLLDDDGHRLVEHGLPPEPYGSGVRAASDYLDELAQETALDWVFLSPPMNCGPMGPVGRTGSYRTGTDRPVRDADGENSLSREDLAVAVVDELLDPHHHRSRYTVGY